MSAAKVEVFRKVPVFKGVKDKTLLRLAKIARPVSFKNGDIILREGEAGEEMFILTRGAVRITKNITLFPSGTGRPDIEKDLITLDATDHPVFGEMALLEQDERTATVCAISAVELLSIGREDFLAVVKEDYESAYNIVMSIACMLSNRLRRTNKDVVKLTTVLGVALARDRMN